ncbi:Hypothetical predicted protein [Pelobates cultripes]|uniref:Uncharacterized protein n=1 Tax=Pelobates cultripes TaxID=61616 RepID=A0AAD1RWJ0_PELCU|nr:Hypothetical predicted protein [Pelobates cultripes]
MRAPSWTGHRSTEAIEEPLESPSHKSMSNPEPVDKPAEKGKCLSKTIHLICSACSHPLPDGYKRKHCNTCAKEAAEESKKSEVSSFLSWSQSNLLQAFLDTRVSALHYAQSMPLVDLPHKSEASFSIFQ